MSDITESTILNSILDRTAFEGTNKIKDTNTLETTTQSEENSSINPELSLQDNVQKTNFSTVPIASNDSIPEPNCLALTVRKDYNLVIVKNIFTATGRLSWKITLSTLILNFLRMLF